MELPSHEGFISVRGYRTWYRVIGNLQSTTKDIAPLLIIHGGPGIPHESLQPLIQLATMQRPVIVYDQLGCGSSDRPTDLSLFTLYLFLEELSKLRQVLGLDRFHLFGHSWGGMLALEYALCFPTHLKSLILASTPANIPHMFREQQILWKQFPTEVHSPQQTQQLSNSQQAMLYFEQNHYCRCQPWPKFLTEARNPSRRNAALNHYMWNAGSITGSGSLANWIIEPRLPEISLPTLITAGYYDGIAIKQDQILHQGIRTSQHVLFTNSSHYAHAEETAKYVHVINQFFDSIQ